MKRETIAAVLLLLGLLGFSAKADEPSVNSFEALGAEFDSAVRPIVATYCLKCHSTKLQEGELDLERFGKLDDVRKSSKAWVKVAEMLDNGEMPPKTAKKPTVEQAKQLRDWVDQYLRAEAFANAGDPGPVLLRRLDNAQYAYTIRDLTGLDLDPAKEFPADGASGEGFTNTGNSLVRSPALLTKYFDAAKKTAAHAVLLPDGMDFDPGTTRRDWSDERLAAIRALYARFAEPDGQLNSAKYLAATVDEREALRSGRKSLAQVAFERKLNERYLTLLWNTLNASAGSAVLDRVRSKWNQATPGRIDPVEEEVNRWRQTLTRFQSVGHMKPWVVEVDPVVREQELRFKFPETGEGGTVSLFLSAGTAGGSGTGEAVVFDQPRIVMPGRATLALKDVRGFAAEMDARRKAVFASAAKSLAAVSEAGTISGKLDRAALARKHGVEPEILDSWLDYLGVGEGAPIRLDYMTQQLKNVSGYQSVSGWGSPETPSLVANSSDQAYRIPGNMKGRGVAVHPSPTLAVGAGWRSPISSMIKVEGVVTHAHPECGNGVTWAVELRRGGTRQRILAGVSAGAKPVPFAVAEGLTVQAGDLISLIVGPRDGNHACDLTDIEFKLTDQAQGGKTWSLTRDISGSVLAANPHADSFGTADVWHIYREPAKGGDSSREIPAGSTLAKWLSSTPDARGKLAEQLQKLLDQGPPADRKHPDAVLYRLLSSLGGPLFAGRANAATTATKPGEVKSDWGLAADAFGKLPNGKGIPPGNIGRAAPGILEIKFPADLVAGAEFVTTARLDSGSAQVRLTQTKPGGLDELLPDAPILVAGNGAAEAIAKRAFAEFRSLFPAALCYTKIVPVDEVVTLTLFHREDEPLKRLMLSPSEQAELDRLWEELHFVSQDALTLVDAFAQLMEYATQDSNPKLFEPYRKPINDRAAAYRKAVVDAQPRQIESLLKFTARAYRRPLYASEESEIRKLFVTLRGEELPFEEAFRLVLARVLVSPAFLYRVDKAPAGEASKPVTDFELASRLSYFLWSSTPDAELLSLAAAGRLHEPEILRSQTRRMMRDDRVRRLSREFASQWLHIYDFDSLDEKSERHFPTFKSLRGDMYEEPIRFFTDLVQTNGSVLELVTSDHTFLNEPLAKHYGIPNVKGPEWRRVDGVGRYGRGGILGFSATLAKQAGASRTSPILRGNWISEALLGERLPRPPKDVPRLPEDEAESNLSVRQLVERHSRDPKCSGCHVKIDPLGFSLEAYDAIGRFRSADLAGHPIDTKTKTVDGRELAGLDGLRDYLMNARRESFLKQFNRKLLGYALGRSVQLSDQPLLDEMRAKLTREDYRIAGLIESIVMSKQFLNIRGRDSASDDTP